MCSHAVRARWQETFISAESLKLTPYGEEMYGAFTPLLYSTQTRGVVPIENDLLCEITSCLNNRSLDCVAITLEYIIRGCYQRARDVFEFDLRLYLAKC